MPLNILNCRKEPAIQMSTTEIILLAAAAFTSYLVSGLNPAIILSRAVYQKDIRTCGSGNPGFTNFKRTFGGKYAWFVFFLDIAKGAVLFLTFGLLFRSLLGKWAIGVAVSAVFAMLGHAFPVWYGFKGGKGFLVCLTASWFLDWRAGLTGTVVMTVLLLTVRFMSLATMCGMVLSAGILWILTAMSDFGWLPATMFSLCVLFMVLRHHENIVRLFRGTEKKTYIFGKPKKTD